MMMIRKKEDELLLIFLLSKTRTPRAERREHSPSNFSYAAKFNFSGTNVGRDTLITPALSPTLALLNEATFRKTLPSVKEFI